MSGNINRYENVFHTLRNQYTDIYQINVHTGNVWCIQSVCHADDAQLTFDEWIQQMLSQCLIEDQSRLINAISGESLSAFLTSSKEYFEDDFRFFIQGNLCWKNLVIMEDQTSSQILITLRDVTGLYQYIADVESRNLKLEQYLQTADQYKQILITSSIVIYQVNFSKDRIENEFYQKKKEKYINVLETIGIRPPCSYSEYCSRWSGRVSSETKKSYLQLSSCDKIISEYHKGKKLLSMDYLTIDTQNIEMWINKMIYLSADQESGDVIGIICLKDVTERYHQEFLRESLTRQASLDLLTGLYNHVTAESMIKQCIEKQNDSDFAFIIFDIDNFKQINDHFGHYFGDCVLQHVATKLKECVSGRNSITARYGGDEFVIYIEYDKKENIQEIIQNLFNHITDSYQECTIHISMGICLYQNCEEPSYYEMYKKADKALYNAKNAGKNQYHFFISSL